MGGIKLFIFDKIINNLCKENKYIPNGVFIFL